MRTNNKLTPVALALIGIGMATSASAAELIEFENGMKLDWRVTGTYTASSRLESRDKLLSSQTANLNGNDGNNNFDEGALTANRLSLLLDATLSKGDSGLVLSASTFYDDVYHRSNDNSAATAPNKPHGAPDEFSDETTRFHGGYTRLLDAYGYTGFDVGEQGRMTVRAGKHVVSWGESLFFPGISLAQGPADGTKVGVPGTETKDQLLPEDQVSMLYEVTPSWSLMAHVQYNWHETIAPAVGSLLSTSDIVGPGAQCMRIAVGGGRTACSVPKTDDDTPGAGQWGVGTRFRVTDETELGLYYLHVNDRTPNVDINFLARAPYYTLRYQEDVKLIGATFSTTFGIATLAGEVSYKQDAPALVSTALVTRGVASVVPTATTADVLQTNVNTFINLGRTWLAPQSQILAEVAYVSVSDPKARKVPGATATTTRFGVMPASDDLYFGSYGLAVQALLNSTYPGIIENWELGTNLAYSQQLAGRTLLGGVGGEGDRRAAVGATMTYRRNLQFGLTYLGYFGDASLDAKTYRALVDRDQLSMTVKYTF